MIASAISVHGSCCGLPAGKTVLADVHTKHVVSASLFPFCSKTRHRKTKLYTTDLIQGLQTGSGEALWKGRFW